MRTRRSAGERRAELVLATLALAGEVGPARVTTEAVAARIGLSHAALFRHFPRKADLWQAVVEWVREGLDGVWDGALAPGGPPEARLRRVLEAQFAFVRSCPALPLVLLSRELQAELGAVRSGLLGVMGAFTRLLAGLVAEGQAAGTFRPLPPPDKAAALLVAMVQGTALRWTVTEGGFDLTEEGRVMVAAVLDGLQAGGPR